MKLYLCSALPVYVFILTAGVLLLIPSFSNTARAQCAVIICKEAPELPPLESESDLVFFPFAISQGGNTDTVEIAANGKCDGEAFSGNDFEVVEEPLPVWILADIECSDSARVEASFIDNGVSLDCLGGTEITCTFTNVRDRTTVPALSEWGMIAAAAGLALIGVFFAVRRRRAAAPV
jgi:hypothetical protein